MRTYTVNPLFKVDAFVECLNNLGVEAYAKDCVIYYDYEKLREVPISQIPQLVYMNLPYMKMQRG